MSETVNVETKSVALETIITNAVKIPGVKVDRNAFLSKTFVNDTSVALQSILDCGPVAAGCSRKALENYASRLVLTRTSESSAVSFAAGLPGGLAMAATIPADTLQFFGMALRLAQELSYLYGAEDLWKNGEIDSERVTGQLIMYCGVMFGVAGASSGVRLLSSMIAKQTLKKLPQKALTKTLWYPVVKQIGKIVGLKITKETVAKGASKAIPVLGGILSGTITFVSMRPMGKRLAKTLDEANFDYTEKEVMSDFEVLQNIANENADTASTSESDVIETTYKETNAPSQNNMNAVFEKLEKLGKLKEAGILTQEEFDTKKAELLSFI